MIAEMLAVGGFMVVGILLWKRLRVIDTRLGTMQTEIDHLHAVESRLFVMMLNANSEVDAPKIEPDDAPVEFNSGDVIALRKQLSSPAQYPAKRPTDTVES
jgi:hypothetical protein